MMSPRHCGSDAGSSSEMPSRREFLGAVAGGLVVLLRTSDDASAEAEGVKRFDLWLRIDAGGKATGYTGKVEYGQGTRTGFAQVIAEELVLPIRDVRVVMGDTDLVPFDPGTYASVSTEVMRPRFESAAARAGELLRGRAAKRWNVAIETTRLAAGKVIGPDGRSVGIGALVRDEPLVDVLEYEPRSKPASEYEVVGTSVPRIDGVERVTGAALYGTDLSMPGIVHGAVLRPP